MPESNEMSPGVSLRASRYSAQPPRHDGVVTMRTFVMHGAQTPTDQRSILVRL